MILTAAIIGWASTALVLAIVIGKGVRFGDSLASPKAEVWMPDLEKGDYESDEEVDDVIKFPGSRRQKGDGSLQWTQDTVDKGVEELRLAYRAAGVPATTGELLQEVTEMLNSQNGEIE